MKRCRGLQDEVESALFDRDIGAVIVLGSRAEELHRVDDRRRRLEGNGRQSHLFHAFDYGLLDGALRILAGLGLQCLRRRIGDFTRVHRIDRTPSLVHIGDHPFARGRAFLLQNRAAFFLDRIAHADGFLVVRVGYEHEFALVERLVQFTRSEVLARPLQMA